MNGRHPVLAGLAIALIAGNAGILAETKERKVSIRGLLYSHETTVPDLQQQVKRQPKELAAAPKAVPVKAKAPALPPRPADAPPPVGIGYTIFIRQPDGSFVRANPNRKFQTGDQIRFLIEPGIDGYLYIIHREDGGAPKLLFPDPRLTAGNLVRAFTAVAVPAETERFNYFEFKDSDNLKTRGRVVENLTVILSRENLGLEVDQLLAAIGGRSKEQLNVLADARNDSGLAMTPREQEAIRTRDLGLGDAPEASVVLVNWGVDPLVTAGIKLTHVIVK